MRAKYVGERSSPPRELARPRLLERVDSSPESAVIWLVAAGGYGKTTLALSYARSRQLPVVMLSIPEGGLTVGGFFYALREQVEHALGAEAASLPLFNPEYSAAPENFARHFIRALQSLFREPLLLLLDNLHHIPADHPLHPIIASLCTALSGANVRVLITSRHEPPAAWIAWRGRGCVELIDEPALSFTAAEIEALLGAAGYPSESPTALKEAAELLQRRSHGWAAALMLMLEHWRRTGGLPGAGRELKTLDEWFAHEVFAPLDEIDRKLLLACALPPRIRVDGLPQVVLIADAVERLERLCREHAFIYSDGGQGAGPCYRLHDLFRAFLQQQEASAHHRPALLSRWGEALWQAGDWNAALPLLISAGDQGRVADAIREVAGALLQTGRGENLFHWLQQLPEAQRRADPHLLLWEGMCLMLHDTRSARALLAAAWEKLTAAEDYPHMAIAWTGIVDSIWLEWAHVSEYEPWIAEFERHEQAFRRHLPPSLWFAALRGMVAAVCYGRPNDPALVRWEGEAVETLAGEMPASERLMLASQLMYLNTWQFGRRAGAARVMTIMRQHGRAIEEASPLARSLWLTFTSLWNLLFEGDRRSCLREAEAGRALILEYGISTWDNAVPPTHAALCFGDVAAMEEWMAWFHRAECRANRPFYDTFQAHFLAGHAWLKGHAHEAVSHSRQSLESARRHGSVAIFAGFRANLASMLAESGAFAAALRESAASRRTGRELPSDFLDVMVYIQLARIPLLRGQPRRMLPYLRRAFAAGSRQRLWFPIMVRAAELLDMCSLALAHDLESDYAVWLQHLTWKSFEEQWLERAPWLISVAAADGTSREGVAALYGQEGVELLDEMARVTGLVCHAARASSRHYRLHPALRDWLQHRGGQGAEVSLPAWEAWQPAAPDAGAAATLKLSAFGGLQVIGAAGERLKLTGRSRTILSNLVANGGRIEYSRLIDLLWPEADGDAARRAADTALCRLRRTLGDSDLLTLSDGWLALDKARCQLDLWRALHHLEEAGRTAGDTRAAHLKAFIALYRGPLLAGDEASPLVRHVRLRFQHFYIKAVLQLCELLVEASHPEEAVQLCERAIQVVPGDEELYLWLHDHYSQTGQAQTAATLMRLRETIVPEG